MYAESENNRKQVVTPMLPAKNDIRMTAKIDILNFKKVTKVQFGGHFERHFFGIIESLFSYDLVTGLEKN